MIIINIIINIPIATTCPSVIISFLVSRYIYNQSLCINRWMQKNAKGNNNNNKIVFNLSCSNRLYIIIYLIHFSRNIKCD